MATNTPSPNDRGFTAFANPSTISQCWIEATDPFLQTSGLNNTEVEKLIIASCARVNQLCNRFFNQQEADEVFIWKPRTMGHKQKYVMQNDPVTSVTDIYMQLLDEFLEIQTSENLQVMQDDGILIFRNYPEELQSIQISQLALARQQEVNIWVRYTSGYTKDDVPEDIKFATQLIFNYLSAIASMQAGVKSFKTQTYSQTSSAGGSGSNADPVMTEVDNLLMPYRKINAK